MPEPRYQVLERIDAGGMAEVFKGKVSTVEGIEKLVAIKRVLPGLTENDKFVRMFLDEARVAMQLSHANIVHVYDVGRTPEVVGADDEEGALFIVMEYVEGVNLKSVIERNWATADRLPLAVSLYVIAEVCKALSYAHGLQDLQGQPLGIVHRDVSPPNILMSRAGEVKLADFGLAKAHSQVEATDPGIVKGKFSYLSREAAFGSDVDPRSDVFATGIVLWELIAGRRLFYGDTDMHTLKLVRACAVPPLAGLHADVDERLSDLVLKALAPEPEQRWQSARELGDALIRYLFARGLAVSSQDVAAVVRAHTAGPPDLFGGDAGEIEPGLGLRRTVQSEIDQIASSPESEGPAEPLEFDPSVEVSPSVEAPPPAPRRAAPPPPPSAGDASVAPQAQGSAGREGPREAASADFEGEPVGAAVPLWIVVILVSVVTLLSVSAMYLWMADSLSQ